MREKASAARVLADFLGTAPKADVERGYRVIGKYSKMFEPTHPPGGKYVVVNPKDDAFETSMGKSSALGGKYVVVNPKDDFFEAPGGKYVVVNPKDDFFEAPGGKYVVVNPKDQSYKTPAGKYTIFSGPSVEIHDPGHAEGVKAFEQRGLVRRDVIDVAGTKVLGFLASNGPAKTTDVLDSLVDEDSEHPQFVLSDVAHAIENLVDDGVLEKRPGEIVSVVGDQRTKR